ncbi:MAG TPA: outer membrane beta-barrel protein, partial [Tenuifilaceae bacterium]|nr:outer membrane beta-barrel protein [Tenuifilaceae bacterium]
GFMDKNQSMIMKDDLAYMDLKQARSWNVNINFLQYSLGFGTDKAGLVTGMGIEFNDYHFSSETTLKNDNGVTKVDSSFVDFNVSKSKLSTTYFTVPLLLEFQIPAGHHRLYVSGGIIGGVRLGSHTKVVYNDGGKEKKKNRDDFNLSTFRYGLTARVGYRGLRLFANYYPTSLFEKDKGPELYPFSLGLVLIDF